MEEKEKSSVKWGFRPEKWLQDRHGDRKASKLMERKKALGLILSCNKVGGSFKSWGRRCFGTLGSGCMCVCVCVSSYVRMYACMYVCMYVRMQVNYVCLYVCIYIYIIQIVIFV